MKKILVSEKAKITPKEVLDEINKFEHINKSPYSNSFYNVPGVTWDYKPEGSLRISDHWNFTSKDKKHCILDSTEELIENNWLLAKYTEGKYHVLKAFGENVPGYRLIEIDKNEVELLIDLYNMDSIVSSKEWYTKYQVKPKLVREAHLKNRKDILKYINSRRLDKFKEENKEIKKVVFIEDKYLNTIKTVMYLYEKSNELENLSNTEEGREQLNNTYKIYDLKAGENESFEEISILVLDNGIAIEFKSDINI